MNEPPGREQAGADGRPPAHLRAGGVDGWDVTEPTEGSLLRRLLARLSGRPAAPAVLAVAGVVAVALLPVGRASGGSRLASAGVTRVDYGELDDGFHHFVVSYEGSGPAQLGAGTRSLQRLPVAERADGTIDLEALTRVTSTGRVLRLERDPGGGVVAVVDRHAETVGSDASDDGDDRADGLRAVPGTREVERISPGTYAVTSSAGEDAYRAVPGVAGVSADVPLGVATSDTYWDWQWALHHAGAGPDIGVEDAWVVSRGAGQVIAVVDSGVDLDHPDLDAHWWRNDDETCGNAVDDDQNGYVDDCSGWDFVNNDRTVFDTGQIGGVTVDNRHSMHVSGTVAAETDNGVGVAGIAPDARIMPLKVTNASSLWMSDAARAIVYAVDNGATVINTSIATSPGVSLAAVAPLEAAVQYAASRGVLVVAAAGNAGNDNDARAVFPAGLPEDNVIAVAASDDADASASFSNWGARTVDLHAPGYNIVSTWPTAAGSYGGMSGTSMAAPMVAGAVALVRSARPDLSAEGVKDLILTQSEPVAALAGRTVSGRRLDVGRILNPTGARTLDPVTFSFDGFGSARAGEPAGASIRASVRAEALPDGATLAYRATLLTNVGGEAHGVAGAAVSTEAGATITDDDAGVVLADPAGSASRTMPLRLTLPAGDYAVVAEAYSTVDGSTIGRPWAVFFSVTAADQPAPAGPPDSGPGSAGTAPTTQPPSGTSPPATVPVPGTGPAGGGTAPTTAPTAPSTQPSSGNPPATQPPAPVPGTTPPAAGPPSGPPSQPTAPNPPPAPPPSQPPAPPATGPAGDEAPPPTRPPATSTSTTTAPPAPVAPPVLPPPPPPVQSGSLRVDAVTPRFGTTAGGDVITVTGAGFRGTMYVLFGTLPGSVRTLSDSMLSVVTPSHVAGTEDIRVSISGGASVVMPDAFTFVAPNPGPAPGPGPAAPTTPTTAAPAPTTTTLPPPPAGGGTPPTTTTQPGAAPSPTGPPPTPTTVAPTTTTTTRPLPGTTPTRFSFGTSVPSGGLRLRPIVGASPLSPYPPSTWATRSCRASSCAGVRL